MDKSNVVDLDALFNETNLLQIYRKAPSFFSNIFNTWVTIITFLVLSIFAVVHVISHDLRDHLPIPFADIFGAWANLGVSLSGTILGFLIGGFAVVCTVLRPQTMIALHKIVNKKYNETELKLLFITFVDILVVYLSFLFISVAASVIGGKYGPVATLGRVLGRTHWLIPFILAHVIFVIWGTWLVMLVLALKSFVYNLYESLLLGLADTVDDYQRQKQTVRCERTDPQDTITISIQG